MKGSAPNSPLIGSHVLSVRKRRPKARIESIELDAISKIIAASIRSMNSATKKSRARKTASPRLPVGESARRQFHWRTIAPYGAAGVGSVGGGLDIIKIRQK